MAKMNIPAMMDKYNLKESELNCIIMYLGCKNKTYSWSQTIGKQSSSTNQVSLANQWFKNTNVEKCIYDNTPKDTEKDTGIIDTSKEEKTKSFEQIKNEVIQTFGFIEDITSENIKELIINEINCSKDPEKRAKVSDLLSLYNTETEDFLTPLIYLPSRCKDCTFKQ